MRVGVCIGTKSNPIETVENQIQAWGKYLQSYDLEAYGDAKLPESALEYYREIKITSSFSKILYPFDTVLDAFKMTNEYIKQRSPDVVIQLWKFNTHGPGVVLAAKQKGVPVITRFTGDVFNEYNIYSGLDRFVIFGLNNGLGQIPARLANRVIALGPYGRSEVSKHRGGGGDVVILPPAKPSEERFHPAGVNPEEARNLGIRTDRPTALFVGRLSLLKGMEYLEDVISMVTEQTEFQFLLVGGGEYHDRFDRKYPNETVNSVGAVPYGEIDKYYKASDIYVHPSQSEGIPLVILEALSCGLTVVAREAGDIGFVTPNIVRTPGEMSEMLLNRNWKNTWLNKEKFLEDYQKNTLTELIESIYATE